MSTSDTYRIADATMDFFITLWKNHGITFDETEIGMIVESIKAATGRRAVREAESTSH